MIHPNTELRFINDEIGYGVVATRFIPKGTITWVLDKLDREFTPAEIQSFEPIYQEILETYTYKNNKGNHVLCWDLGRFVNHSFNSNCLTTAYDLEIAIRDIQPGEQLTDDYGYLNINKPFRAASEGTKRKVVYPDDLKRYYKVWDKKLMAVLKYLPKVEQPLMSLVPKSTQAELEEISKQPERMTSVITCYYDEKNAMLNGYAR